MTRFLIILTLTLCGCASGHPKLDGAASIYAALNGSMRP